jgi:hypothetical protein
MAFDLPDRAVEFAAGLMGRVIAES